MKHKQFSKNILSMSLSDAQLKFISGGDNSPFHDLVAPISSENYGTGGPPPLDSGVDTNDRSTSSQTGKSSS